MLRAKGYTGEGFWSAGRVLISAEYTQDRPLSESEMPLSLCGGMLIPPNPALPNTGEN